MRASEQRHQLRPIVIIQASRVEAAGMMLALDGAQKQLVGPTRWRTARSCSSRTAARACSRRGWSCLSSAGSLQLRAAGEVNGKESSLAAANACSALLSLRERTAWMTHDSHRCVDGVWAWLTFLPSTRR